MRAELYWIEGPWPGRLAVLPRPRGADWLEDEIRSLQQAGVNVLVSLLTSEEVTDLNLAREAEVCQANGIEYISFPITDRGVPSVPAAAAELVRRLESKLREGKKVTVHCRVGIGRSALLATSLLMLSGVDLKTAFERVRRARGCPVPDTDEQRQWVARFARNFLTALPTR